MNVERGGGVETFTSPFDFCPELSVSWVTAVSPRQPQDKEDYVLHNMATNSIPLLFFKALIGTNVTILFDVLKQNLLFNILLFSVPP